MPFSVFFVLFLPLSLLGCGKASSSAGSPAAGKPAVVSVREVPVVTPTPHPWLRSVVLHGTLEARERVQIAARVAGPIGRLKADLGDTFATGALLAHVDSAQILAEQAEVDAELAHALNQLARIDAIRSPEAVSRREADEARTRVTTLQAQQAVAAQRVKDLKIVAPFAGTVARRYVSLGAFVKVGDPLFDFVSNGPLRLALEVPERFVREIGIGTRLQIEAREGGQSHAEAEIVRVSPALNEQTRTLRVEASVNAEGTQLRPGSFVLSTIALGMVDDAMQLPRGAVYSTLGQDRVTIVDDKGQAQPRDVDLVGDADGFAYVRGVSASDRVISQGGSTVAPATIVKPVSAPTTTTTATTTNDKTP